MAKKVSLKTELKAARMAIESKDKWIKYAEDKIYQLENQIEKQDNIKKFDNQLRIEHGFVEKLMEIIRWQIKPDTTTHPFEKSLSEKGPEERQQGRRY